MRYRALAAWLACAMSAWAAAEPAIEAVAVVSRQLDRKVQLPGEFLPYQSVAIQAKITGFVEKVYVDRGSQVKEGQVLATMVAPELNAQRAEAQAKVQAMESQRAEAQARAVAARSTFDKLTAAAQTPGVIAGNELVQAENQVKAEEARVRAAASSIEAAQAGVKAIEDTQAYLRITAPFSGVIAERNVHPGALAGPSGPVLFQLEQESRLRLVVAVPEIDIAGIARGARVSFKVPAYPGETFTGVIARVGRSMDAKTRTMAVELDVANANRHLAVGMYPAVTWPVRTKRASLLVPPTSVVTTTEKTFVNRVNDGKVEWVPVTRGAPMGDLVEVFGPLREGDLVARRGTDELREGAPVNVKSK